MRTYIKDLKPGDHVSEVFRLLDCQGKGDNPRGPELTLKLGDKTGDIRAIQWKSPYAPDGYEDALYVLVTGKAMDKGYGLQIEIERVAEAHGLLINESELVPCAKLPLEDLKVRLSCLMLEIKDPLIHDLVDRIYLDNVEYIHDHAAAKAMHHAVKRGLFQHTIEVAETALALAKLPQSWGYREIDTDIVIAGALLHDIGKIIELKELPKGDYEYSRQGSMLGHIVIGIQMIIDAATFLPLVYSRINEILHVIVSHHGKQEHGSPVTPATPEAVCVHLADMFSMTVNVMDDLRDKAKVGDVSGKRADIRVIVHA